MTVNVGLGAQFVILHIIETLLDNLKLECCELFDILLVHQLVLVHAVRFVQEEPNHLQRLLEQVCDGECHALDRRKQRALAIWVMPRRAEHGQDGHDY